MGEETGTDDKQTTMDLINTLKDKLEMIEDKYDNLCLLFQVIIVIQLFVFALVSVLSLLIFPLILIGTVLDFAISIIFLYVLESIKVEAPRDERETESGGVTCARCKQPMEQVDDVNWYCKKDNLFYNERDDRWYRTKN